MKGKNLFKCIVAWVLVLACMMPSTVWASEIPEVKAEAEAMPELFEELAVEEVPVEEETPVELEEPVQEEVPAEVELMEVMEENEEADAEIVNSDSALAITKQPESVLAEEGAKIEVTVEATGEGLTYTWYFANGAAPTVFNMSSQKTKTYSTEMTAARNGYRLYCVVKDANGNKVTSETVTLTMKETSAEGGLAITKQPESVVAEEGEKIEVTVEATGEGLTYTWYFANGAAPTVFSMSSQKTKTYSTEMTAARNGYRLYCVVKDANGNKVTSDTVTLTMKTESGDGSLTIVKQPVDTAVELGERVEVTVEATGEGLTYLWYFALPSAPKIFYESSQKTNTYSAEMTAARNGYRLYCVVTDKNGATETTETVTISIKADVKLEITKQPENVEAELDQPVEVTVEATGEELTYTWFFATASAPKNFYASSQNTNTYSTVMTESRNGYRLYCVITDKYGNTVESDIVTISIKEPPEEFAIVKLPVDTAVALGERVEVTVEATGEGLTYLWYFALPSAPKIFYESSQKTNTYSAEMTAARNGYRLYCVVTDENGATETTETVTISVKADVKLEITKQPENVEVELDQPVEVTVEATGEELTYTWFFATAGAPDSFYASSQKTNTYSTIMTESRNGYRLYCVITDKYGNTVESDIVTITVKSVKEELVIVKQPQSVEVEAGQMADVTVEATGEGLTYAWYFASPEDPTVFQGPTQTTKTCSMEMDSSRNGFLLYCIITDKYGNTVQTDTVTITMKNPLRYEIVDGKEIAITGYVGTDAVVEIPESIEGLAVVSIKSKAFAGTGITEIKLPATIGSIAKDAFEGCEGLTITAAEGTYAYNWGVAEGYIPSDDEPGDGRVPGQDVGEI